MSVTIKKIDDRTCTVNNKLLYKDINENWVATTELTPSEKKSFHEYLQVSNNNTKQEEMSKSLGEKRIRPEYIELSESRLKNIDLIKQRSIENIDFLETMKALNPGNEKSRLLSIAQTKFEEATMWAVKGLSSE